MARFTVGGCNLFVGGKIVPVRNLQLPSLADDEGVPPSIEPVTLRFRARLELTDPVDRELAELDLAERVASRPMSPHEVEEARAAATFGVFRERLLSSVRLPRPTGRRLV